MSLEKFQQRFRFHQDHKGKLGVEREWHIKDKRTGLIVPRASGIIPTLDPERFSPELSACQIEGQTPPCQRVDMEECLHRLDRMLSVVQDRFGFDLSSFEVGPEDMPLDVYPDKRYQEIARKLIEEGNEHILRAACRVIGTHVHRAIWVPEGVKMSMCDVALHVYNHAIQYIDELIDMGDGSNGGRMKLYLEMGGMRYAPRYDSWAQYHDRVCTQSRGQNPRDIWDLIRFSENGTIEFRMFGATSEVGKIMGWVGRCDDICHEAMDQL